MTTRAIVFAIILSIISIFWIHQASLVEVPGNVYAPVYLLSVPPVPAVFCLILLVALMPLSGRIFRRALEKKELIVIFMFLVVAIPPVTFGITELLIPWHSASVYFNTPQNEFQQISEAMPQWFYPHDESVILQMFEGSDDGSVPWRAWYYPLGMWTVFMVLFFFTGLCLNSMFRKQWVEAERLRFPLLFIPVSIVEKEAPGTKTSFFKNPLVWVALGLVTLHHFLNVMHAYNPSVLALTDRYGLGSIFTERPWTAFRSLTFFHRPQLIGLAYFVSLDILFSGWFFRILMPALQMFSEVFGLQADPGFPYANNQGVGAYVALLGVSFWVARGHISNIISKTFGTDGNIDDTDEPMGYRWMLLGTLGGVAAIIAWSHIMGFSVKYSLPFFLLTLTFGFVYSRVRAEAGLPSMWAFPFEQDSRTIKNLFGTDALISRGSPKNLVMLTSFTWMARGYFTSQMGYQIENEALADRTGMKQHGIVAMMVGAFILGCVVAYYANLRDFYQYGALVLHGGGASGGYNIQIGLRAWNEVSSAIVAPGPPNIPQSVAVGAGAVVTVLLVMLRWAWLRSPLHPLGYAISLNYGYALWGPFFITWIIKSIVHRIGGARLFRQLMPFFLGLALADLLVGGMSWIIMAIFGPDILGGYVVQFG